MKSTTFILLLSLFATSAKHQPGAAQTPLVLDRALATESDEGPMEISIDMGYTPCEEYYLSGTVPPDHVDCTSTKKPTPKPTPCPTADPTESPTKKPTPFPTAAYDVDPPTTESPTKAPTGSPTKKTQEPTKHAGEIPLEPSGSSGDTGDQGVGVSSPTHEPTKQRTRKPTHKPNAGGGHHEHSSSGDHWTSGHHGSKSSKSTKAHVDCDHDSWWSSSKSGKSSGGSSKSEKSSGGSGSGDGWHSHRRLSGEWWSAGSKSDKSSGGSKSSKSTKCYHEGVDSSTLKVSEMLAFKDAQNSSAQSNRSLLVNFALAIAAIAIINAV